MLINYIIKIVEDMPGYFTYPFKCYWFYYRFSMYQAIGLASVLVIGIEISMGFDRSTLMFSIVAIIIFNHKGSKIYAEITKLLCPLSHLCPAVNVFKFTQKDHLLSHQSKTFLLVGFKM
jgi:hypothetical protein